MPARYSRVIIAVSTYTFGYFPPLHHTFLLILAQYESRYKNQTYNVCSLCNVNSCPTPPNVTSAIFAPSKTHGCTPSNNIYLHLLFFLTIERTCWINLARRELFSHVFFAQKKCNKLTIVNFSWYKHIVMVLHW